MTSDLGPPGPGHRPGSGSTRRGGEAAILLSLLALLLATQPLQAGDKDLEERYRQIVTVWAAGPGPEPVVALKELLADPRGKDSAYERALQASDRRWIEAEPQAALALAQLQGLTKLALIEDWRPGAEFGSDRDHRSQVVRLVNRRLARLLGTTGRESDGEAARIWASLGYLAMLLPEDSLAGVEGMFRESLARDPTSVAALHGLAYLAERNADFVVAEAQLERLLVETPDHPEARLRHALVLERRGRSGEATPGLIDLARSEAPDWIRRLAYQEAVRGVEATDPAAGRALLDEAMAIFPTDRRLRLLQAHRSRGQWQAATDAVVELAADWQPPAAITPRLRYDFGPLDDRAALLARTEADLVGPLAALRRALAQVESEGRR